MRGQVDKYTWVELGSSWVMSDLLAGILFGQLGRAEAINQRRLEIWTRFDLGLRAWAIANEVSTPVVPDGCEHVGHLYFLRFKKPELRTRFIAYMRSRGIAVVFHYQSLNVSPIGKILGGFEGQCPIAEEASECLVRLPLHLLLSDHDVDRIIEATTLFEC